VNMQLSPRGVIACPPHELHEVGPRMLVDALEADGWEVEFFGVRTPLTKVVAAVREHRARFIGLTCAIPRNLDGLRETISDLREELGQECPPVLVGGAVFRGDPDLWKESGADLFAPDLDAAVELLRAYKD
jgi:MerR family transcriptional regulator, light-induced transcriptional regulator